MASIPFIPDNSPFDAAQRIWLNGFLAGLFAHREPEADAGPQISAAAVPMLFLYGSQTGTSEGLSRRLAREANGRGCAAKVVNAAGFAKVDWAAEKNLIVVTSTYGDGDMPDNAQPFWDWLQTDAGAALAHLSFGVLALGDSNYPEFCAAGRKIDERLAALGAKRLRDRVDCDVDYETAAARWFSSLLQTAFATGETAPPPALPAPASYGKQRPFPAKLLTNHLLTGEGSGKETRHFEISLEGSGLEYESGDALGIYPANCPELVQELIAALGCDGEEAVALPDGSETSLRVALLSHYDVTRPSNELFQKLAPFSAELRGLLAPERKDDFRQWMRGREVIDLVRAGGANRFSAAEFATLLKKISPRLYSISSSPKAHAGQVHLTVGIVRYASHGRQRKGVCSTFLADRVAGDSPLPIFIQTSHGFRLPANGDTPVIMVGPGTGIAPFRGFLHERKAAGATGKNWLFFGEQRSATDFLYRRELEEMQGAGHLTRLSTSFSRDQAEKIYVQHRMLGDSAELWAWLEEGAHFYVCGDASRMAKDVDAALHTVIRQAGGKSAEAAAEYVQKLKTEKRYQRDVY